MNTINNVTYKSICNQYDTECLGIINRIKTSKNYVRSDTLKANFKDFKENLLDTYSDSLSSDQKNDFEKYADSVSEEIISEYQSYLNSNKIAEPKSTYQTGIDRDPETRNSRSYMQGGNFTSDYAAVNGSYSMADMVASISIATNEGYINTVLGSIQTLSYSIYQKKSPVRNLGNMNPKDWVFGPRTIAGSLVFAVFNKHWMMNIYDQLKEKAKMENWHFITDEIPPFDITISFANEYGYDSRMALYGVRIMNEGQVMSTNDIFIENTYQFVASDIELMDSLNAYQTGQSRHKYVVISKTGEYVEDDEARINPIDKDNIESSTSSENVDVNELVFSDEELDNMTREEALTALREKYLELEAKLIANGDTEGVQSLGLKYNSEYDRIKAYYDKKEVEAAKK